MRAVGIILAGGNNHRIKELTTKRAACALPVAGSYRSIDFALSNMSNAHINKVAVFTQYNAGSLNEHLSSSTTEILLQKIEEMTLYILQLEERVQQLENGKGGGR